MDINVFRIWLHSVANSARGGRYFKTWKSGWIVFNVTFCETEFSIGTLENSSVFLFFRMRRRELARPKFNIMALASWDRTRVRARAVHLHAALQREVGEKFVKLIRNKKYQYFCSFLLYVPWNDLNTALRHGEIGDALVTFVSFRNFEISKISKARRTSLTLMKFSRRSNQREANVEISDWQKGNCVLFVLFACKWKASFPLLAILFVYLSSCFSLQNFKVLILFWDLASSDNSNFSSKAFSKSALNKQLLAFSFSTSSNNQLRLHDESLTSFD